MRNVFLLMMLLVHACCLAQAVSYSYDAAGNRVRREMVVGSSPNMRPSQGGASPLTNQPVGNYFTDQLSDDYKLKLTPQSDGTVRIEATCKTGSPKGSYGIYNANGVRLLSGNIKEGLTIVSLAGHPTGVYILIVDIDGNKTSWKVTKL